LQLSIVLKLLGSSSLVTELCNAEALAIRYGLFNNQDWSWGIEKLLLKYGVDFYFAGHTHHTEITYPVAKGREVQLDYVNPKAPIHCQIGVAGVGDGHDPFDVPAQSWDRVRDLTFQRTMLRVTVHDATRATADTYTQDGAVLDTFTVVQNNHGPFQ
jgi:hypothetical protein